MNPIQPTVEQLLRDVLRKNEEIGTQLDAWQGNFNTVTSYMQQFARELFSLREDMLRSSSYHEWEIQELEQTTVYLSQEVLRLSEDNQHLGEVVARIIGLIESGSDHFTIHQVFRVVNRRGQALDQ